MKNYHSSSITSGSRLSSRLSSIDALRGLVMVIMALDHVRDFFHAGAVSFSPTDLTQTNPILFFTRWITHFCMPVFMFAAGMGIFLYGQRARSPGQLSRFLLTRGVWFLVLELTVMRLAYDFSLSLRFPFLLLILWIFGLCMIVMAALHHLPLSWLAALSLPVIALHNCLDRIPSSSFGSAAWLWNLLHQPGAFRLAGETFIAPYPVVPWIAVMAAGYCFGRIFSREPEVRRSLMLRIGPVSTIAFLVTRAINRYGDPVPWTHQKSAVFTVLSFLNCTKYPASLDFVLMTLGPAILLLAYFDGRSLKPSNAIVVFGRVPMFYFVLHFYLIHTLAVFAEWFRYGPSAARFTFSLMPSMGGPRDLFPANLGYPLWVVYGVWMLTVILLYPLCRWFAKIKASRHDWWLSYL